MEIAYPPLRYDCLRCGKSCQGMRVVLDPQARAGIDRHPLALELRSQGVEPLVVGEDGLVGMAGTHQGGACPFRTAAHLCGLHCASGPELKPRACRQFPFFIVQTPDGPVTGLSFRCTAVQQNQGRSVSAHDELVKWLLQTGEYPRRGFDRIRLAADSFVDWEEYRCVEALGQRCVEQAALGEGLWDFVSVLARNAGARERDWSRERAAPRSCSAEVTCRLLVATLAGCLEAQPDVSPAAVIDSLASGEAFYSGRLGRVVNPAEFEIGVGEWLEADIRRYLSHLLFRKFLLEGPSLLAGATALLVLAPLLRFYARLWAVADGRDELQRPDMARAFDVVEGEVVAHAPGLRQFYGWLERTVLDCAV